MKIREFLGSTVLDKNAYEVGKVDDIDFNPETGEIEIITLTLQKNIFSKDEIEISFDDVATIGAYVILNKEIPKETEPEEAETVEATIEVEDDEEE
ncbi:PRC-barrel domain-containing protein [Methanobrevibacter sp.]